LIDRKSGIAREVKRDRVMELITREESKEERQRLRVRVRVSK
jgi:hypothetical protein